MARMTREEMDRYDREMMGIMNPQAAMPAAVPAVMPQASPPLNDPEGRPLTREYSLDDIRRFFGFGPRPAMSAAEAADAAQMYERVPNRALPPTPPRDYDAPSPSIPYMPSTDPRGAAAPIPPPPLPARPASRLPVMRGLPTNEANFVPPRIDTLGGVSPADMAAMQQTVLGNTPKDRRRFPMNDRVYFAADPSRVYTYDEFRDISRGNMIVPPRNPQDLARALEQQAARERGMGMRVQPMGDAERQLLMQRGFGVRVP